MDINQALGIAKNLKNHFRTFEKIDEFLKEVASAQVFMNEVESRKAELQSEIESLQEKKERMSDIEKECAEMERKRGDLQSILDKLRDGIADIKAKLE